jgi:hypothetical protein
MTTDNDTSRKLAPVDPLIAKWATRLRVPMRKSLQGIFDFGDALQACKLAVGHGRYRWEFNVRAERAALKSFLDRFAQPDFDRWDVTPEDATTAVYFYWDDLLMWRVLRNIKFPTTAFNRQRHVDIGMVYLAAIVQEEDGFIEPGLRIERCHLRDDGTPELMNAEPPDPTAPTEIQYARVLPSFLHPRSLLKEPPGSGRLPPVKGR